jgi:ABC-type branched-subunit amino acid transport system substrate-binding protein
VVGHMCSSSCVAGAPIYDAAGYTTISPSCTAPDLTFRGFTSFNRAVPRLHPGSVSSPVYLQRTGSYKDRHHS